jgi:hypothetical protein
MAVAGGNRTFAARSTNGSSAGKIAGLVGQLKVNF